MPDNVTANGLSVGGGPVFGADEIAGVKFPRSKLIIGADGVNDGDVSLANPLPVAPSLRAASVVAGQITVGVTAVQLTSVLLRRVRIKAPLTNLGLVYLGPDASVTTSNGYVVAAGETTPPLELSNLNAVWAIADTADQKIMYLGEV